MRAEIDHAPASLPGAPPVRVRPADPLSGVHFEVSLGGHSGASALVRRRYQQRGLGIATASRLDPLPGVTVAARHGTSIWATLRLGLDSIAGLQADALYRHEIDRLRGSSRRIAEVTRLAIDAPCPPAPLLRALVAHAMASLRNQPPVTDLVIEVHPRHARFYVQGFAFTQIGAERLCERVDAPAVLLHRALGGERLALASAA